AATRSRRSLPISFVDLGATLPMRLSAATTARWYSTSASFGAAETPVTSPSRCSIAEGPAGASTIAAPATTIRPNRNASTAMSIMALDLDLDDLPDPDVANRLHDDGNDEHHLTHVLPEQQVHVVGI